MTGWLGDCVVAWLDGWMRWCGVQGDRGGVGRRLGYSVLAQAPVFDKAPSLKSPRHVTSPRDKALAPVARRHISVVARLSEIAVEITRNFAGCELGIPQQWQAR